MKKLIFVLSFIFAATVNVNAQDTKLSNEDNAKKEAAMLAETVGLTETQTEDFYRLFVMKYETLADENLTIERKQDFLNVVMLKIQASLDEKQMKKLEANNQLLARIKGGAPASKSK